MEADRQQLENDLDDAKDSLQVEIQRYTTLLANYEKLKMDTDKRIIDKDEEIDSLRQSHRRQLESMQSTIEENESRHKSEIMSIKKKYQVEIEEIRTRYEVAKKAKLDAENTIKKYQQSNKELHDKLTEEQHMHDLTREQLSASEKRASSLRAELEETKMLFDRVKKNYKFLFLCFNPKKLNYLTLFVLIFSATKQRKRLSSSFTSWKRS